MNFKMLTARMLIFALLITVIGCNSRTKVGLYKNGFDEKDLVAIFESKYPDIAYSNCQMFADLHKEKYSVSLDCRRQ